MLMSSNLSIFSLWKQFSDLCAYKQDKMAITKADSSKKRNQGYTSYMKNLKSFPFFSMSRNSLNRFRNIFSLMLRKTVW